MLREIVKEKAKDDLNIQNLDDFTCTTLKESNLWKEKGLKPKNGPFDTWANYCKSTLAETFKNNIEAFPCAETCGLCTGRLNFIDHEIRNKCIFSEKLRLQLPAARGCFYWIY